MSLQPLETQPQLAMFRSTLFDLPALRPPKGFHARHYQPGDDAAWDAINCPAFGWDATDGATFERLMRLDPAFRPERVWFVCRDDRPLATASAWHQPPFGPEIGTIHWVGVHPDAAGNRLGYWVSLAALYHMLDEGRTAARLTTDDFRIPAIKTYLKLGFAPMIVHRNQRERWNRIFESIGQPERIEEFAMELAAEPFALDPVPANMDSPAAFAKRRQYNPGREHRGGARGGGDPDFLADESLYRPSRLGTVACSIGDVVAGSDVEPFTITYTAGADGLPTGATFRLEIRGQSPLGLHLQSAKAKDKGYVRRKAPKGVTLTGNRALGFTIKRGELKSGDQVTLSLTNTKGLKWNPVAARRVLYPVIGVHGSEPLQRLPEHLHINIVPGAPAVLEATAPATHQADGELRVHVTARDVNDNRVPVAGPVRIAVGGTGTTAQMSAGIASAVVNASGGADTLRAQAVLDSHDLCAVSNPSVTQSQTAGLHAYFGDLHCHDMLSEAEGYVDDVYRFAVDDRRLDFFSLAIQSHGWHSNEKHTLHKYMNERFLDEGNFVTLLAFEWQHSAFGDKVVHYLGGDHPFLPVDRGQFDTPAKLYEGLLASDAFIISHHVAYPTPRWCPGTDWSAVDDRVERCVEIWSMHGSSEGYNAKDRPLRDTDRNHTAYAALRRGLRLGFVAGSDSHSGRPGGSAKEPCGYWGGMAGIWAPSLTRRSIFSSVFDRHTWACTRARIVLRMTVNGALMGSETDASENANIRIDVWSPGKLKTIEVMKNTHRLQTFKATGDEAHIELSDVTGGPAFYHCRVTQEDGELAVGSPVWVG